MSTQKATVEVKKVKRSKVKAVGYFIRMKKSVKVTLDRLAANHKVEMPNGKKRSATLGEYLEYKHCDI